MLGVNILMLTFNTLLVWSSFNTKGVTFNTRVVAVLEVSEILNVTVSSFFQARSQDQIWGGAEPPKRGPFGPKK